LWDNIPRGFQVTCPHIERSCTSAYYADRVLGVSEMVATAATTIHHFSGNNIAPKGDSASRGLKCELEADRPDPANRKFKHPDPVEWTLANREKILAAMFAILLGNPTLEKPADAEMKTRFKTWYRLVGSAVENAAAVGEKVSFEMLFVNQDDADEDAASLSELLVELAANFRGSRRRTRRRTSTTLPRAINSRPSCGSSCSTTARHPRSRRRGR
jgi:hypothetical protein